MSETVTVDNLNTFMEFDCVIRVHEDGTVERADGIYAPSLYDDELDSDKWTMMNGYSGQYGYRGPIMHNSEFIGGGMAKDILAEPGVYVALVSYYTVDEDDENDVEGWAVAKLNEEDI